MKHFPSLLFCSATMVLALSCAPNQEKQSVNLPYEQYTMDNGLKVVLHQDKSDPMVALAIQYHVGSGREKTGKTGFAHFFEHMLFQRSENLPRNAFFQNIAKMGGTFNGSTNTDGTNYFEVVPRDALEKILWMESDRMGFFINTVTQAGLEREIDIVSNEKRQNYDSKPYGHHRAIVAKELFPAGHPYSWTTIGEIADLRGATLDDVKEFYSTYYTPGNATLVLSGDFDVQQAKDLIQKYFGEIAKGKEADKPKVQPVAIESTKKVVFEDSYAKLPQLSVMFAGVESYNEDSYALSYLNSLLAGGKNSPMYKVIVQEKKLAPSVSAYHSAREVAGYSSIDIRAFDGVNLDTLYSAIEEAMARFEAEGVDSLELQKLKMSDQISIYNSLSSIQGKALMMARSNEFGGRPDKIFEEIEKYKTVTAEDIMRVYNKYFKGKNYFALSIVPKDQASLAMSGSKPADIVEEKIEAQQMKSQGGKIEKEDDYPRTASSFDRSKEPDFLPNTPQVNVPTVWSKNLSNQMNIYGVTQNELPMIQFRVEIKGGMMLHSPQQAGLAYITARMLSEGTELKSAEELEQAMGLLGARINTWSGYESMGLSGSCLSENFDQVVALVEEMMLKPRFDSAAFERVKAQTLSNIRQSATSANDIANLAARKLLYGSVSSLSQPIIGTEESVKGITLEDVKAFYKRFYTAKGTNFNIAGDITLDKCENALSSLTGNWEAKGVIFPELVTGNPAEKGKIYFVDYPGAQQSMIVIGGVAMPKNAPEYFPATVVNYKLGGGSHGELFDVLRLQKGYTYGAYSKFDCGETINMFNAYSSVQGSATKESVDLFNGLISGYGSGFDSEKLESTRAAMLRAKACSFETLGALVDMLSNISAYGLAFDYVKQEEGILKNMTLDNAKETIAKTMNTKNMVFVVVGDAKTQFKRLAQCGLGEPVLINKDGEAVSIK